MCLALGIDDPEQWLHQADPRKVAFWLAFYQLEPWGNDYYRDSVHSMQLDALRATVAAPYMHKRKKIEIASVDDFMPSVWRSPKPPKAKIDTGSIAVFQAWASKYRTD